MLEALRKAGLTIEPHDRWFRPDTPDVVWLPEVGKRGLVVLMRDKKIGTRHLELEALLNAGVKAFVLVVGDKTNEENAAIIIKAMPRILQAVREYRFPFIAKIQRQSTVNIWKTRPQNAKGLRRRVRKK